MTTNTDVEQLIAEAEAALEGVTPGKWKAAYSKWEPANFIVQTDHPCRRVLAQFDGDGDGPDDQSLADARFIAWARNNVPALIAALEPAEAGGVEAQSPILPRETEEDYERRLSRMKLAPVDALVEAAVSEDDDDKYLIVKRGMYYRPNSQGYTSSHAEAGRYTLAQAVFITHPNGPDGPRDGMSYVPARATLTTEKNDG